MSNKQQVLILGGGYAGCNVAKQLDTANTAKKIEITLVTPRENFVLHKVGALRAAVKGKGTWSDRVLIPTTGLFSKNKSGRIIVGTTAASVDETNKTCTLQDGTVLKWDVLVVATGSTSNSPGEPPASISTRKATKQYFEKFAEQVAQSKSVLIVGTGPVGLELAGEIRDTFGEEISIHCVSRTTKVLEMPIPVNPAGVKSMQHLLDSHNIQLWMNDELQEAGGGLPWFKVPTGEVQLKSGKTVKCDLVVFAAGQTLNTSFLPEKWLDGETNEVVIDKETFEVSSKVFSLGDCAKTDFTKLSYIATGDAQVVAKNVLQVLRGERPTNKCAKRAANTIMLVSFGTYEGRGLMPWFTLGNFLSAMLKTKDMFTKMSWETLGADLQHLPVGTVEQNMGWKKYAVVAFAAAAAAAAAAAVCFQQEILVALEK